MNTWQSNRKRLRQGGKLVRKTVNTWRIDLRPWVNKCRVLSDDCFASPIKVSTAWPGGGTGFTLTAALPVEFAGGHQLLVCLEESLSDGSRWPSLHCQGWNHHPSIKTKIKLLTNNLNKFRCKTDQEEVYIELRLLMSSIMNPEVKELPSSSDDADYWAETEMNFPWVVTFHHKNFRLNRQFVRQLLSGNRQATISDNNPLGFIVANWNEPSLH
jgi:hypothetical protein